MLIYPSELAGKIEYDESGTLVPTCELTEEEQKIFDEFAEADKRESEERFSIREGAFFIAFFREGGGIVSYKQRHSYLMKKLYIFRYLL